MKFINKKMSIRDMIIKSLQFDGAVGTQRVAVVNRILRYSNLNTKSPILKAIQILVDTQCIWQTKIKNRIYLHLTVKGTRYY